MNKIMEDSSQEQQRAILLLEPQQTCTQMYSIRGTREKGGED